MPTQRKIEVQLEVTVEFDIKDQDAIDRCFTDEWRSAMYNLRTEGEVLEHWAAIAIRNGTTDVSKLDGWADLEPGVVTMEIKWILA
jgi:hypothetical protein